MNKTTAIIICRDAASTITSIEARQRWNEHPSWTLAQSYEYMRQNPTPLIQRLKRVAEWLEAQSRSDEETTS